MKKLSNVAQDDLLAALADVEIIGMAPVPTMAIAITATNEDSGSGATMELEAQLLSKKQNIIFVVDDRGFVGTTVCIGMHIHMYTDLQFSKYICIGILWFL